MTDYIYKRSDSYRWYNELDDRQRKEIDFNKIYKESFSHGTDGHNVRLLIALMSRKLNEYEDVIDDATSKDEEIANLKDEYGELKHRYDKLESDMDEYEDLHEEISGLEQEIHELEMSNDSLSVELEQALEQIKELEKDAENVTNS